jgi:hypothetical protein
MVLAKLLATIMLCVACVQGAQMSWYVGSSVVAGATIASFECGSCLPASISTQTTPAQVKVIQNDTSSLCSVVLTQNLSQAKPRFSFSLTYCNASTQKSTTIMPTVSLAQLVCPGDMYQFTGSAVTANLSLVPPIRLALADAVRNSTLAPSAFSVTITPAVPSFTESGGLLSIGKYSILMRMLPTDPFQIYSSSPECSLKVCLCYYNLFHSLIFTSRCFDHYEHVFRKYHLNIFSPSRQTLQSAESSLCPALFAFCTFSVL